MTRAVTDPNSEHRQLVDDSRAAFVTELLSIEAHRNTERELLQTAAKDAVPALARKARRKLLAAAACCDDPAVATELRGIATRLGWALEDVARNLRRQRHGLS